jgi:hypothetical protein
VVSGDSHLPKSVTERDCPGEPSKCLLQNDLVNYGFGFGSASGCAFLSPLCAVRRRKRFTF